MDTQGSEGVHGVELAYNGRFERGPSSQRDPIGVAQWQSVAEC